MGQGEDGGTEGENRNETDRWEQRQMDAAQIEDDDTETW